MSGPESQKPDDQLLEEFLAGEGVVRSAYREIAQQQAPPHLDASILQAAQAAARPVSRLGRYRWRTPLSAAAVLVLSLGVVLQVQRDPAAQHVVASQPVEAEPVAPEMREDFAKAESVSDAASASEAKRDTTRQPANAESAKPKSAPPALKHRAAPAVVAAPAPTPSATSAPPPPPVTAMADAAPSVMEAPAAAAVMATESAESSSARGAVSRESAPLQKSFAAAAAAPMAKASRGVLAESRMRQPDAPGVLNSAGGTAAAIERWAQRCGTDDVVPLSTLVTWRGLAVSSWVQQSQGGATTVELRFAPQQSPDSIAAALGTLASKLVIDSAQCRAPVTRELRQVESGWALVCECPVTR